MVDVNILLRQYLLSQTSVTALLGTNSNGSIYASADIPEKVSPALGPFIQIIQSGGSNYEEIPQIIIPRMMIRPWADVGEKKRVAALYRVIYDVLNGTYPAVFPEGVIMGAKQVTGPQEFTDPDTGWVALYGFYSIKARPN